MFKLALVAGHNLKTPKGCFARFDPNETREWVLNDRIADKLELRLSKYDGIEVLRIDDTNGVADMSLSEITGRANSFGADFYLSIHHNGGIMGGDGGGIVAITHTTPQKESLEWQRALYDAAIRHTGLVGNRAEPLSRMNLHEVRETAMPAVLMECGFMDSSVDVPIILSEEFADKMADAFCEVIVERSGATLKRTEEIACLELPVLRRGSKGGAVKSLQSLINSHSYEGQDRCTIAVDGSFGGATESALTKLQRTHALVPSGVCDTEGWRMLLFED